MANPASIGIEEILADSNTGAFSLMLIGSTP